MRGKTLPLMEEREWRTLLERRTVLVVVHTLAYGKRLVDVLAVLQDDFRLQVVFTAPPHVFGDEVPRFLRRLGGAVVPWDEAVRMRFDLALAAGPRGVEKISAPVLTLPHGARYLKRLVSGPNPGVAGLRGPDLMPGGRLPAAVALAHRTDRSDLARNCPQVLPVTHVVGDPVHDRIVRSLPLRARYRRALGLPARQRLVAVVSTWGTAAAFGRFEALLPRLITELPADRFRAALLVHPNVWSGHGPWQMRAWLARWARSGVALVPPEADWRSVLIAADWIIGDHGSVTLYGTLTRVPILLASAPEQEINPISPAATLAVTAPALSAAHPLVDQLDYAAGEYRWEDYAGIAARITSEPGRFNRNMRRLIYRLLRLGRPAHEPETEPLPEPPPLTAWAGGAQGAPV